MTQKSNTPRSGATDNWDTMQACPTSFNLARYVLCNAQAAPDKVALELLGDAPQSWSYARLTQAVRGVATGLLRAGFVAGDVILLRLGNTPDFPIAYLGAIAAGIIPCPTSSALTVAEISKMAAAIGPKAVLQDDEISAPKESDASVISLTQLREMYALPPADWHMGAPERPAYMIFTSGTSGTPRAVLHAHRAIWARRMMRSDWSDIRETDRLLHAGAFNWTFTLGTGLMDPWSIGATALIAEHNTPIQCLPALIAQHNASIFAAAPGVFRKILSAELPAFTHLRHALSAGEKMPVALHDAWYDATKTRVFEAYGMSECSTFISSSPRAPVPNTALGRPQSGRRIALLDSDGNAVDAGEIGTIAIHRSDPGLMLGYYNAPEETAARFLGDWFLTGDLAHADDAGNLFYEGRSDDMMNAGGFRVSPFEVEAVFNQVDGLHHCAAVEVTIKPGTQLIALCYCAEEHVHENTLHALATNTLARYKQPRIYHPCDALPLSANGKLLRRVLRSQIEALYGQT